MSFQFTRTAPTDEQSARTVSSEAGAARVVLFGTGMTEELSCQLSAWKGRTVTSLADGAELLALDEALNTASPLDELGNLRRIVIGPILFQSCRKLLELPSNPSFQAFRATQHNPTLYARVRLCFRLLHAWGVVEFPEWLRDIAAYTYYWNELDSDSGKLKGKSANVPDGNRLIRDMRVLATEQALLRVRKEITEAGLPDPKWISKNEAGKIEGLAPATVQACRQNIKTALGPYTGVADIAKQLDAADMVGLRVNLPAVLERMQ